MEATKAMHSYSPSSTNLFVRYLPHEVDDNRLREIFSAYGNITSSMVMRDIHNGQSFGTAFVRYATHEEALRALQNAHGLPMAGKTIAVQWARQQHDGTPAGQDRLKMNKLFLRNVPEGVTEDEIVDLVRMHGSVVKVTMHNDTAPVTDPSLRRRIAFITFSEHGAADAALRAIHNTCAFSNCHGIPLMCKLSEDYAHKNRTPRTPHTPHTPLGALTPHAVPSPHSPPYALTQSRGNCTYSNSPTARSDHHNAPVVAIRTGAADGAGYATVGTPRVIDTPRSVGSVSAGRTNQTPRTLNVVEVRSVQHSPRLDTADSSFDTPLVRTREQIAIPTTITAPDSGLTVTVRHRPNVRKIAKQL